jgi:hypothetical protein
MEIQGTRHAGFRAADKIVQSPPVIGLRIFRSGDEESAKEHASSPMTEKRWHGARRCGSASRFGCGSAFLWAKVSNSQK